MNNNENCIPQIDVYIYLMLINCLEEERCSKKALERYYQGLCDGYASFQVH